MRTMCVAACLCVAVLATARPARAQSDVGAPLGSLYLSPLPNEYQPTMGNLPLFVPQTIYLVADIDFADIGAPEQNTVNGIRAWEASVVTPPEMIVTGRTFTPPTATQFAYSSAPYDYLVDMGMTLTANELPQPLLQIDFILTTQIAPPGFVLVVGPPRDSPQTVPGHPIWQEALTVNGCVERTSGEAERCYRPFATLGNLVLSEFDDFDDDVSADQASWTTIKSGFRP